MSLRTNQFKYISNLSWGFLESAFLLLAKQALPVYKKNIDHIRPPVAGKENVNSALAIVTLMMALDHHLCRLKYLRDVAIHNPSLPYTPYFNWGSNDDVTCKVQRLLNSKNRRLSEQLVELTVCRDSIVHPKFYVLSDIEAEDFKIKKVKARLVRGVEFRNKTLKRKLTRKEVTKLLKLPVVPIWVSYVDAVICVLVLHRFLNLLASGIWILCLGWRNDGV